MKKIALDNEARERIAFEVASGLITIQKGWANWMHRQSERIPRKARKALFIGLGILSVGSCIGLMLKEPDKFEIPTAYKKDSIRNIFNSDSLQLMERIYKNQKP